VDRFLSKLGRKCSSRQSIDGRSLWPHKLHCADHGGKNSAQTSEFLSLSTDYILVYAKSKAHLKFRALFGEKLPTESVMSEYSNYEDDTLARRPIQNVNTPSEWSEFESRFRVFSKHTTTSSRPPGSFPVSFRGSQYTSGNGYWKTGEMGFSRLIKASRLEPRGTSLRYVAFFS
jgi:adenine-specific DNA-methyltransferase